MVNVPDDELLRYVESVLDRHTALCLDDPHDRRALARSLFLALKDKMYRA